MAGLRIAIVAPTFQAALHAQMFSLMRDRLRPEHDIHLSSITGDAEVQKTHLVKLLARSKPDALIAIDVAPDASTVAAYRAAGAPIILIDEEAVGAATITTDNLRGGVLAGEYLVQKGRRRIAVISGMRQAKGGYNAMQRVRGVQQALAAQQLSVPPGCLIEVPNYTYNDGFHAMAKLLDEKRGVDAVFCAAGDACAGGILKQARDRGVQIPADVAVIGFDDMEIAQITHPPLTTVRQPLKEMAEAAYRMATIERAITLKEPKRAVFQPALVIRESA